MKHIFSFPRVPWRAVGIFGAAIVLLACVQVTTAARFKWFGAVPDLMLAFTVGVAFFSGEHTGAVTGISAGALAALLGSHGIVTEPAVNFLAGYTVGLFAKNRSPSLPLFLIATVIATALRAAETAIQTVLTSGVKQGILHTVLRECAATALACILLALPAALLCGWAEKRKH